MYSLANMSNSTVNETMYVNYTSNNNNVNDEVWLPVESNIASQAHTYRLCIL